MAKQTVETSEITILEITQGEITFFVVGTMPLIFNSMSGKSRMQLLMPRGRLTAADKLVNIKHVPLDEFRGSIYRSTDDKHPTRLLFPSPGFKGAMMTAALVLPGTKKSEIGRLCWVSGTHVAVYGVPKLMMSVVRSADMNRTPDIRTRAILPQWACKVTVSYVEPNLTRKGVSSLMAAAGIVAGVGDFRQEKGKGSYGQFRVVDMTDPEFTHIVATGGRAAQDEALKLAEPFDAESAELLDWYATEIVHRGREPSAPSTRQVRGKTKRGNGVGVESNA